MKNPVFKNKFYLNEKMYMNTKVLLDIYSVQSVYVK